MAAQSVLTAQEHFPAVHTAPSIPVEQSALVVHVYVYTDPKIIPNNNIIFNILKFKYFYN